MREYSRKNSLRLQGYNYSRPGTYFITICAKNGELMFGDIRIGEMHLNEYGRIVSDELLNSAQMRNLDLNCFVVMPNHIHFILVNTEKAFTDIEPTLAKRAIPAFVQAYKAAVTRTIGFSLWHRSFHDAILKSEDAHARVHSYIQRNPSCWEIDSLHPTRFVESEKRFF